MSIARGARLLRRHLRPRRRALRRMAGWSALEAVPTFASGLLVSTAIDHGFLAGRPLQGFGWLAILAALWIVGALGTRQLYPWLAATIEPLRDSLSTEVVSASLRRVLHGEEGAGGSSVAQATAQVETVRALLATMLRNMRQLVSAGLAALGGLTALSPRIALIVAPFVLVALALFAVLLRVLIARYRAVVLREEAVSAEATVVVEGLRDVVAHAAEVRAGREVGETVEAHAEALRAFARARVWGPPVVALGVHLPLLALLALSPWLVANYGLTVGQIVGSVFYLLSGLQPAIKILVNAGGTVLVSLGVVLGRLAEVCAEPPAPSQRHGSTPAGYDLEMEGVTFAYSPDAEPVVHDLTLDISAGAHLAVVGPSGVGKSTLANMLAKLAIPQRGSLRFGGVALEEIDERYLRTRLALIPQEAYVFAGTLRENLSYLRPHASELEIERAVAAVGLEETQSRLGGYDAEIRPGGGALSPGECQLIALARVYLSLADVVILDEATCHLDPVAEERAERAFACRHGTLIVIAHRISSVRRADRILLMDGSRAMVGTHDELLRRSHLYAELVGHWHDDSRMSTAGAV